MGRRWIRRLVGNSQVRLPITSAECVVNREVILTWRDRLQNVTSAHLEANKICVIPQVVNQEYCCPTRFVSSMMPIIDAKPRVLSVSN